MEHFSSRLLLLLLSHLVICQLTLAETGLRSAGVTSSKDAFACPAPKPCLCERSHGKLVLYCRQQSWDHVPSFNHSEEVIDELTLANNRLLTLPDDAFRGLTVRRLDLRGNQLNSVSPAAFSELERRLEELVIELNPAADFPSSAVARLAQLRVLEVIGYGRESLPVGALASLGLLRELHLTKGGLRQMVPADVTAMQASLSVVDLSYNPLGAVPTAALVTLSNLTEVHLTQCSIARLGARAFANNSTGLRLVDLSFNQLEV